MRFIVKRTVTVAGALLCAIVLPVRAQSEPAIATANSNAPVTSRTNSPSPVTDTVSLSVHLQLQGIQIEKLDRLYEAYAANRLKAEANLDKWQSELKTAQSPSSFDERKANRLIGDINKSSQKVAGDLLATRSKALAVLGQIQRSQLQSLANDARFKISPDRYYQLLILPVENVWRLPLDADSERKLLSESAYRERQSRHAAGGNYGVYGGYGYGRPGYGVYGSYGRGGVGVHAGIGRDGPSLGISIGNIFGFGR